MPVSKISPRGKAYKKAISAAGSQKAKWNTSRNWELRKLKKARGLSVRQERSRKQREQNLKVERVSKSGLL